MPSGIMARKKDFEFHYIFSSYHTSILYDDIRAIFSHQNIEESRVTRRFNSFFQKNSVEKVNVLGSNIQFSKSLGTNSKLDYGTDIYYNTVDSKAYELNILDSSVSSINSRYLNGGSTTFFPAIYGSFNLKKNRLANWRNQVYLESSLQYLMIRY